MAGAPSAKAQAAPPAHGAPAAQAQLQGGSIFYTNNGNVVQLTPSGTASNYGSGYNAPIGLAFDSTGNLYVGNYGDGTIVQITPSGDSTIVASGFPALALNSGMAVDAGGNLFVAMQDLADESQGSIVEIAPDGSTSTFVSGLSYPISVIFDPSGNLLMVANGEVEKVTPGGVVSTYASSVPNPFGIALDQVGNLFVSDFIDGTVYEVAPGGATSLYASGLGTPYAIAVDAGENLFVVNSANQSIIQIAPNGAQATVATGGAGGFIVASPIPPTAWNQAPEITQQPSSQAVVLGSSASLSVMATGGWESYQWSLNSVAIPGATGSTLTIGNVQAGDLGSYSVTVTNSYGSSTSNVAVFSPAPTIATQPADQLLLPGVTTATFTVATTDVGDSFQWQFDGVNIPGGTGESLTVSGVSLATTGSYDVVLTNANGSTTSDTATLYLVDPLSSGYDWTGSDNGHSNAAIFQNGRLEMVTTPAVETLQVKDSSGANGGTMHDGVTEVLMGTMTADWSVRVSVHAAALSVSSTQGYQASLLLFNMQTGEPYSIGDIFGVEYNYRGQNGTPPLEDVGTINWGSNNYPDTLTPPGATDFVLRASFVSATHVLTTSFSSDGGETWTVSDSFDVTGPSYAGGWGMNEAPGTSFGISLEAVANGAPVHSGDVYYTNFAYSGLALGTWFPTVPTFSTQPVSQVGSTGATFILNSIAVGGEPVQYQWYLNGAALSDGAEFSGSQTQTLTISNARPADEGSYTVVVSATPGGTSPSGSLPATLTLTDQPPVILVQPPSGTDMIGATETLAVNAFGSGPITYQWLFNGSVLPGATGPTLVLPAVSAANAGQYQVIATNSVGSTASALATFSAYPGYHVSTLAGLAGHNTDGPVDGIGSAAEFSNPSGITWEPNGYLIVADEGDNAVRSIAPGAVVTTLGGSSGGGGYQNGPGSGATFNLPTGVAVDASGSIFVADLDTDVIRMISTDDVVSTYVGAAFNPGTSDGTGFLAQFYLPFGVAMDKAGNLYVSDSASNTIRMVAPGGVVTTVAGVEGVAGSADGGGFSGLLNNPMGIALDGNGNIYVADNGNSTIRKVSPGGIITTLAGQPGNPGASDGLGSAAQFNQPVGIAVDASGNVYVGDMANDTVRMITPSGMVSTLAGVALTNGVADGTGISAHFNYPLGVAVDPSGNVYVADSQSATIRELNPTPVITGQSTAESVVSGQSVSFSVGVAGGSSPTIQWEESTDGGSTWVMLTDGGVISGSTTATLEIGATATAMSGYLFEAVVSDPSGTISSQPMMLSVTPVPPGDVLAYDVTTLAGGLPSAPGGADGTGPAAQFNFPTGIARDGAGNLYVADAENDTIRRITPAGVVTTIAGTAGLSGSADGTGAAALFNAPHAVAVDTAGDVYVADSSNDTIRRISPTGVVTTVAGLPGQIGLANGTGSAARFNTPSGLVFDAAGNLYVSDASQTIRMITPAGVVTTFVGDTGVAGSADGTGSAAQFNGPSDLVMDAAGNIYVADAYNDTVRLVTPSGVVTTIAGSAGQSGTLDGSGGSARFNTPYGLAIDAAGNLYVADTANRSVRMIVVSGGVGTVTTLLGGFGYPEGIAVDGSGGLYVTDAGNNTLSHVVISGGAGTATVFAGQAPRWAGGFSDGIGSEALFSNVVAVAVDDAGNIYATDSTNYAIRRVTPSGVVTTLAGGSQGSADGIGRSAQFQNPGGVAVDSANNVYVLDNGQAIRKISPAGVVTTIAGAFGQTGSSDGTGAAASFGGPNGTYQIAVDGAGNIYVPDAPNSTIRMVTPAGVVTTIAGLAGVSGYADGTGSAALFDSPDGIAVDRLGNLYVTDEQNEMIRKITPGGAVTTVAGNGFNSYGYGDGSGTAVEFEVPNALAVDGQGIIYVADGSNAAIRRIDLSGNVTTIAGYPQQSGEADGIGRAARFGYLIGIAVDGSGKFYVADYASAVRVGTPTAIAPLVITAQPADQTVNAGQNATFQVSATGLAPLSYQWQILPAGSPYLVNLADGGQFSGSATPTLTISGATVGLNGAQLQCIVSDATTGLVVSNPATLTVHPLPVITSPSSATGYLNAPFIYQTTASYSPTNFSATGLPAGLTFNTATGVILGSVAHLGTYNVTLTASNAAGSSGPFALAITIVPVVPPVVTVTSPANGATFVGPVTIALAATATSVDSTIKHVVFYDGATKLATVSTAPYQYSWRNVGAGSYAITAVATDNFGLASTSAPVTITVNADVPPAVAVTSPADGAMFVGPVTIPLTATASSTDSTVAKVDFYSGATKLATDTAAPYSYSWKNVVAGTYTITAVATDALGIASTSAPVTITVNADVPPAVAVTSPANGAMFVGPVTIPLTATASSTDSTVTKVEFYNGTTKLATDTVAPYAYSWKSVGAGTYTITAVATDALGSTTTSAAVIITVNADVPPAVAVTSPANGATFTGPVTIPLTATASSTDSTVTKVDFYNGTTKLATSMSAPYAYSWKSVGAGTYTITAVATDALGSATTSAAVIVTVNADVPPAVAVTSPANGATFKGPVTIPLAATASSTDSTVTKVEFYNGTTKLATDTTAPYTYSWKNVGAGSYSITAVATDALGGTSTSAPVNLTVNP